MMKHVTAEEQQGPLEFPAAAVLVVVLVVVGGGGAASLNPYSSDLSLWEIKQDTCFF